jgi:hypothetical protein
LKIIQKENKMNFGIRRNLSRNMYLSNQNQAIEDEIERLRRMSAFDINAQNKINELEKQKTQNYQTMASPITEQESLQYDDYGHFVGEQQNKGIQNAPNNDGILQTVQDGVNHVANGVGLGLLDEASGVIGGVGRVLANTALRAAGQPVNGESIADAWNKGYTEYRDYARKELSDGAERNPGVSLAGEVVGSLASPVKLFKTDKLRLLHPEINAQARLGNALTNGAVSGAGYTDDENADYTDYGMNILKGVATGYSGYKLGSNAPSNNFINQLDRNISNATANLGVNNIIPKLWDKTTDFIGNLFNNDEDEEDEEEKRKKRLLGLL